MQEVITMIVFAGFMYFYMKQPLRLAHHKIKQIKYSNKLDLL
jgi:uncharacterized protein (DUF486 family)